MQKGSFETMKHIAARIELTFWQFIIDLLSRSKLLQQFIRWTYLEVRPSALVILSRINLRRFVRWSATGLGLGVITGLVISFL
jgi:hypothetical protein